MSTATDTQTRTKAGFAIGVRYLTGYAVAALPTGEPEWPPHPARLFMALTATCFETGGDSAELDALRWLEQQPDPEVWAAGADPRESVTAYVPPNDFIKDSTLNKMLKGKTDRKPPTLPRADRQPRTFPRVHLHDETMFFVWSRPLDHAQALSSLAAKLTRLGHSSSLVYAWVDEQSRQPAALTRFRPTPAGSTRLRGVHPGTLDHLTDLYRERDIEDYFQLDARVATGKAKAKKEAHEAYAQRFGRPWKKNIDPPQRLRPQLATAVAYEAVSADGRALCSCFDPNLIMLRLSPRDSTYRQLDATASPAVCGAMRNAVMSHAPDGLPVVSGHQPDGKALAEAHMAVLPLPMVGGPHADGHLLGVGVALPREVLAQDRHAVLGAIQEIRQLTLGQLGVWSVEPVPFDDQRKTLQVDWWTSATRASACWATATPIALDRHAKSKDPARQQEEVAAMIRSACLNTGLPEPSAVVPFPVSAFPGVPDAGRFPRLARKDGSKRRQAHALLWFEQPVVGPVLLGAGRFRGWGVCRPYNERGRG